MPYNLLYTRNRVNDAVFDVTDIPITDASIMIESISFLSKFNREFARVCPIVPSTSGGFEEGRSRSLNFARSRLVLDDFQPPYFLRFYPRYNISKFAVSVYSGDFAPIPAWKTIAGLANRYRLLNGKIDVSFDNGVTTYLSIFSGSIAGYLLGNTSQRIYARLANGSAISLREGNWNTPQILTIAQYNAARVAPFVDL